ncbi:MAG: diguanylate cyclase [Thermoleophilia bacterium]|jgi:diguanylate cyclase (GGDEF)-like protein/PAS domain S-box-containing protein|nr:diguanylate cyclase [Thermoleophilia bacterium]
MSAPGGVSRDVVDGLARRLRALEAGHATREVVVRVAACEICGTITPHSGPLCPDCRRRLAAERMANRPDQDEPALATLLAGVPGAVFRCALDPRRTVLFASERIGDITGHPREDFLAGRRTLGTVTHPEDREATVRAIALALGRRSAYEAEYRVLRPDGTVTWVSEHGQAGPPAAQASLVGVLVDVTERRHRRDALARMALHDPLTGLPNRRALDAGLARELLRQRARGGPLAVAAIDVDMFKLVNDTHGHATGDRVLVGVGERLRACAAAGQVVARSGGEEFTWTMPGLDLVQAAAAAEALRAAVASAPVGGLPGITVSVGVADSRPGEPAEGLLARADSALYAAKAAGRNRVEVAAGA